MQDRFTERRLLALLEEIPVETRVIVDWDSEKGFAFLRECREAIRKGASWEDLAEATGIEELRYVYLSREKVIGR